MSLQQRNARRLATFSLAAAGLLLIPAWMPLPHL
jgi:hypothetical protein